MNTYKILIVEDEKEIRDSIKLLLDSAEYDFIDAENGVQGLQKISDDLDLVILDIMIAGWIYIYTCRSLRYKENDTLYLSPHR